MKKVIRLTESQLTTIIKRVISEQMSEEAPDAAAPNPMACLKPLMEKGKQVLSSCFEKNDIVGTNIPKVLGCVAQKIKTSNDPALKAEFEKAKKCLTSGGTEMDKDSWPQAEKIKSKLKSISF